LIERVLFDGADQGFDSFFPNWVPVMHFGRLSNARIDRYLDEPEDVSGKRLHANDGLVIRHADLRFHHNQPLIGVIRKD